jgi:hypothetical protein
MKTTSYEGKRVYIGLDVCAVHELYVDGVSPLVKADGSGGLAKEARVLP